MYLKKDLLLNTNIYDLVLYWIVNLTKNMLYLKRCEYVFRILVVNETYVINVLGLLIPSQIWIIYVYIYIYIHLEREIEQCRMRKALTNTTNFTTNFAFLSNSSLYLSVFILKPLLMDFLFFILLNCSVSMTFPCLWKTWFQLLKSFHVSISIALYV